MPLRPYLTLLRPANLVTAVADILAGASLAAAVTGGWSDDLPWLCLATLGLYGGGVVFNDVFDLDLDRVERPERALPSGQVSLGSAILMGGLLLLGGVAAAALVSSDSGSIALAVALLTLLYNGWAKHHSLFGPVVMGLCRGGNLLLGVSLSSMALMSYWWIGLLPVVFIAAITLTSRGEVGGRNRASIQLALGLDATVALALLLLPRWTVSELWPALPFFLLWFGMNLRAKVAAIRDNQPPLIKKAVKTGVISLIPLNACLAAGFMGWPAGLAVLALLPVSFGLARYFAVT
ncbi:4-hydroxybenzoate polyprenyltransferase [Lewinella marina]|uniref:Polyprenyltransferase n=1 Tax=Neolewinella marina TaxID=438751 RepID=A0A2G0CIW2_9BACT|nr:UbiA-like protein EboC [Neolewinella marina]NJB85000.1 4-hydroxybenzoate polyprenyltransferase [Neolewinella marina]PHK99850.1 polyprenyltransferase [Neolewinella marina]